MLIDMYLLHLFYFDNRLPASILYTEDDGYTVNAEALNIKAADLENNSDSLSI